jgi:3-hydroxy-D-aspartate aldolase
MQCPTGTFEFEVGGVYTELQCCFYVGQQIEDNDLHYLPLTLPLRGSLPLPALRIFMDADYGRNLDHDGAPTRAFEPSLFVWATVMSRPAEDRAIVDAGLKALAFDSGPPLVCDEPAATYERASDDHGRLAVSAATNRLALGDKIRLIPGHSDPTVNLYDWYVCIRNNRVEQLWPITARGAVY